MLTADPDFLTQVFGPPRTGDHLGFLETAGRVVFAGVLGLAVGASYRLGLGKRPSTAGLTGTLVMLAMLIALITLAIGDNAAKAFTLVGTLAIVRFRTAVRDIRDTAYVIFAVGVGIAIGAFNPFNALAGTLVVGLAGIAVNRIGGGVDEDSMLSLCGARLLVRFDAQSPRLKDIDPLIAGIARHHQLIVSRDGRDGGIRLLYAVDIDRARAVELLSILRDVEGVRRVTLTFGEIDDDD